MYGCVVTMSHLAMDLDVIPVVDCLHFQFQKKYSIFIFSYWLMSTWSSNIQRAVYMKDVTCGKQEKIYSTIRWQRCILYTERQKSLNSYGCIPKGYTIPLVQLYIKREGTCADCEKLPRKCISETWNWVSFRHWYTSRFLTIISNL